jgi:predicted metalloprotease
MEDLIESFGELRIDECNINEKELIKRFLVLNISDQIDTVVKQSIDPVVKKIRIKNTVNAMINDINTIRINNNCIQITRKSTNKVIMFPLRRKCGLVENKMDHIYWIESF